MSTLPTPADAALQTPKNTLSDRLATLSAREARLAETVTARGRLHLAAYEFIRFGLKMAWASLFAGLMLALLVGTFLFYPKNTWLARYDFLVLAALTIQVALIATRLETWEEARVIAVYHVAGTLMELVKTSQGSWVYPEPSLLRIGDVPLFSGFMYACVGSFMMRAWNLFEFRFDRHPPLWALGLLSAGIYLNFLVHKYVGDARYALFALAVVALGPATIHYRIWRVHRRMPLLLAAILAAFFIWLAENVGTFAKAWAYPYQRLGWSIVHPRVYLAWFLLMIVSYTLVVALKRPEGSSSPG
ncbi:MAG: hypothetical protein RL291_1155 [Pseudomonadota bacterium]